MHERPARPAPPPAHPFLLLHPSINPTPKAPPQRGRAYRPSATNRQQPKAAVAGGCSSPRQTAKIVTGLRAVQSGAQQNLPAPHLRSDQEIATQPASDLKAAHPPMACPAAHPQPADSATLGRGARRAQPSAPTSRQPRSGSSGARSPPAHRETRGYAAGRQSNRIGTIIQNNRVFCFREKEPTFYNDSERRTCRAKPGQDRPDRPTEENCEKTRNRG